jgi:hypothetical protein
MLRLTRLGVLALLPASHPARVTHGRSPDRVRGASSASPRLTAKLTTKLLDNRGSRRTALDGYTRPELRRCGRR